MPGGSGGIQIGPVFLFGSGGLTQSTSVLRGNRKSEKVEKLQSISVPRGELGLVNKSWAELPPTGCRPAVSAVAMQLRGQSETGISIYMQPMLG